MEYFMDTPFIVLIAGPSRTRPVTSRRGRAWVRLSVVHVLLTTSICSIARFSYYSRSRRTSFRPFGYMAEGACREATDTSAAVKSLPRTLQWTLPFLFEPRNPHACHIRSLVVRIPVGVDHHAALGRAAHHAQAGAAGH